MIERGIQFIDKESMILIAHSFYDLNLILSGVEIPPAKPKTTYVDIPGGDGSVDLTEANGEVKFYDRDCKFTFTMNPADDLSDTAFEEKKTEVSNLINGRVFKIILDKDDGFYYLGRCEVNEYLSNKRIRQIVVTAKVDPYKYKKGSSGRIFELTEEPQTFIFKNGRKTAIPMISCQADTTVVFNDVTYCLDRGDHKITDIQFVEGENEITIYGTSETVGYWAIISYQEGEL